MSSVGQSSHSFVRSQSHLNTVGLLTDEEEEFTEEEEEEEDQEEGVSTEGKEGRSSALGMRG